MYSNNHFINIIKLLIYKENPSLFEKVNFDDDNVFLEPLFFAYFNSKKDNLFATELLTEIMQGYFLNKESLQLEHSFNNKDYNIIFFDLLGLKYKYSLPPLPTAPKKLSSQFLSHLIASTLSIGCNISF